MDNTLKLIADSLDGLSSAILKANSDDRTFTEMWGWNFPPLNRHDLANLATQISEKIKNNNIDEITDKDKKQLDAIPKRIKTFQTSTLQYFYNGHGNQAVPVYISLIEWITATLEPLYGWEVMYDNKALPSQLTRKLRSIQSELSEIIPNKQDLQNQIEFINKATEAAETLPTDLASLKEARGKVDKYSSDAAVLFGKIETYFKKAENTSSIIEEKNDEASKLVSQCEEAYRITTTKGLASAFDLRASKLSNSMWLWVVGLIIALLSGIFIGGQRFEILNKALNDQTDIGHIWIQIFLSMISFGAPIWFAWIATKQISQRFKLAEDYAFKASVAKAYEGYRKEAARIDKNFETRLFNSALTRLEEAPLRLMDKENHGSPWHELINSPQFLKAIETLPELKDKFFDITKQTLSQMGSKKDSKTQTKKEE